MELADGTIVRKMLPVGAQGHDSWKQNRNVVFNAEPITEVHAAVAHVELGAPKACIVIAQRGPKGGWPYLKFVDGHSVGSSWLRKVTGRGYSLHLGWIEGRS